MKTNFRKRVKKTIPSINYKKITVEEYVIQCPHCATFFKGGYNRQSLRILCSHCNNPIEIEWDKAIKNHQQ